MLKRIGNGVNNTVFSLDLSTVVFLTAVSSWPSGGNADVKMITESGAEYVWPLNAQDVTDLKVGLTGVNNDLRYIRKSAIESVTLDNGFFPSGQFADVTVLLKNGKSIVLSVHENDYNLLLS